MKTTVNYTLTDGKCTGISSVYIESTFIDEYIAALPSPTFTLKLEIDERCGNSATTIDLDSDNLDLVNNRYEVTSTDTALADGIYSFRLVKKTNTGDVSTDKACAFFDCTVNCLLIETLAEDLDSQIFVYYQVLNNLNACDADCDDACIIYNAMDKIITETLDSGTSVNQTTNKINQENGCGC